MNYKIRKQFPKSSPAITGALSVHQKVAQIFDGLKLLAELEQPEIIFINRHGLMLKGYEPNGLTKTFVKRFAYQEWFCVYAATGEGKK